MQPKPTVLITGASTGIGAVYADRFARRGHPIVMVARDTERMRAIAAHLRAEAGVEIEILKADLNDLVDVKRIEARLRDDPSIGIVVNNAGTALPGTFSEQSSDDVTRLIGLNVTALTRLASAVAPRFGRTGQGAIINIGSVVGLAPELGMTVYGATKAFVLFLSQGLHVELGPKGVYVQAVLPSGTRTEIWQHAGRDVNTIEGMMDVEKLVDAALVGFDKRETVTIPPLPDLAQWQQYDAARTAMLPGFRQSRAAARYTAMHEGMKTQ
ncbi:SDR family NAD(P)-dependent oxidoreductase [Cupriavidus lacunae]|uniref:NADP-dependent 3-hydroxy acid dehydrogenase YdfG n=1 Tax=Cupriavidus lacunae TaxID=2666307 RepID=A0A370P2C5_9BURK|nr:SDR family oxidoreductase [Cupriavidus lacunae]RDK11948.1 SDR family oxidoreductase [Cupriavidus lacunae]